MNNHIIIGSKPLDNFNFSPILDVFEGSTRLNMALPHNNNGTRYDEQFMNCHIHHNLLSDQRLSLQQFIDFYSVKQKMCTKEVLEKFYKTFNKENYTKITKQDLFSPAPFNQWLKDRKCPYQFAANPRCGFNALYNRFKNNLEEKIYLAGWTINIEEKLLNYHHINESIDACHDKDSELKIVAWLHENNFIDATLCALENETLPTLNCKIIRPTAAIVNLLVRVHGICILKNYYSSEVVTQFKEDCLRIFKEQEDSIQILDKEDCSNDERIFHAENHSEFIRDKFANEPLFTHIAGTYNPNVSKNTLINRVTYEEGKVKNSGAGWHRDTHHCQFKGMIYLSDVTERNGNFQWITNSSQQFIGLPDPRTADYDTRFHDHTIEEILAKEPDCNLCNIVGRKGTVILANTTYIHRGNIIAEGERVAMTQYYF